MIPDKLNEENFDHMLSQALQRHREPVPADFTDTMLRRVKQAEQQRILAHVVLQERLALAACIALASALVIVAVAFPGTAIGALRGVAADLAGQGQALISRFGQAADIFSGDWRVYVILASVLGFAVYSLVELFVGDRLRIA
jgi:hypothetical protein